MNRFVRLYVAATLTLLLHTTAFPHEYWFEPESFFPAVGQKVNLRLYAGEALKREEERPFQKEKTKQFRSFFGGAWFDFGKDAADNSMPFYSFTSGSAGSYLLAMERNWSFITLKPSEFNDYLREDGMEYIIAEREKLGESAKDARERYSRYVKTLLQVGDKRDNSYKQKAGLRLEIVPLEDPYAKKVGDTLDFQIFFDGKSLDGRTVFADSRDGENISKAKLVSDKKGRVTVKLDRPGVWLVRLVLMQRCKSDCGEAEWESFWGAFSFGVR